MNETDRRPLVAVVDDDPSQRQVLRRALEAEGFAVAEAGDGQAAIELARRQPLDAMLLDVRMPRLEGIAALPTLRSERPELVVILLTAFIDVRDAVAAIKHGAHDYLEKPVDLDELIVVLDEALGRDRPAVRDRPDEEPVELPPGVVAESAAMRAVFNEAACVAPSGASVLLLGESGTGKEVLARFIHEHGGRREGPFVAVNCAALPESLIESELFGHERGAFTGAAHARPGRFEEASAGTLLLDEIGEMPLALQPKLLRVLEERTVRRVGGMRDLPVDPRVIASTNRPLEEEARAGRFREDLLYRLNVFTLRLPPLRERRDDILPLADRILAGQGHREKRLSPAAQRALLDHTWPGNVRELRNAILRAAIISRGSLILPEDLPDSLRLASPGLPGEPVGGGDAVSPVAGDLESVQRQAILAMLAQTGGNKTRAAELLGISRRNLIYKLRSYGL